MEQKKKNSLMVGLIYLVIFAVYNLFVFMVFDDFNNIFWISYVFMLLAYGIHIACVFNVVAHASVKTVFFGIPLVSFSIFFLGAEFFASLVFMIFRDSAGTKATIFVQTLLLAAFIVIAVISVMTRDTALSVDNKIKTNVLFINSIKVDVDMLMERSTDPDVTAALKKLSETVRYSDPMTNPVVATQEQMILQYVAQLKSVFDEGDANQIKDLCKKIDLLFVERNKKIMISK